MKTRAFELLFLDFFFVPFFGDVFAVFRLSIVKFPEGCGVFGAFLRRVRCEFRSVGGAAGFHLFGFLLGKRGDFFGMNFSSLFGFFFLFLDKFSAANERVGLRFCRGFFVFSLHKVSGQCSNLIFAKLRIAPSLAGFLRDRCLRPFSLATGSLGMSFRLRARVRQEPAGQPAGETTRNIAATWAGARDIVCWAGRKLFRGGLLFVRFAFRDRRGRLRCYRFAAILGERFSWK